MIAAANCDCVCIYDTNGEKVILYKVRTAFNYDDIMITDIKWSNDGEYNVKRGKKRTSCIARTAITSNNLTSENLRDDYNILFISYIFFISHFNIDRSSAGVKTMFCCAR